MTSNPSPPLFDLSFTAVPTNDDLPETFAARGLSSEYEYSDDVILEKTIDKQFDSDDRSNPFLKHLISIRVACKAMSNHKLSTQFETNIGQTNRLEIPNDVNPSPVTITIGIDWADQQHEFAATLPDGFIQTGSFQQKPAAIKQWIDGFRSRFPQTRLDIAIETSR